MPIRRNACAALLTAALLPLAAPAAADAPRFYVGFDGFLWDLDEDRGNDYDAIGVRGRAGVRLNENVALEGHLATAGSDRSGGERRELDSLYAAMLRADLPLGRYTSLYGLAGFAGVEVSGRNAAGQSVSGSESGVGIGLGADYEVTRDTFISIDYVRYVSGSDFDFSGVSVGARYAF